MNQAYFNEKKIKELGKQMQSDVGLRQTHFDLGPDKLNYIT